MKKLTNPTKTVDAFIKSFPEEVQKILKRIRKEIKAIAPKAEESISYGIPAYKVNGKPLVYFSGYKKHIGFYPITAGVKEKFKKELDGYKMSTGTVQFQLKDPIPYELIKKITKYKYKLMSILVFSFMVLAPVTVFAQSNPVESQPIQRIIEEEGAQSFSQPIATESRRSNNSAIYGLLATGLVLVAAGAVYLLWTNQTPKND